jgi:hypothetical protein
VTRASLAVALALSAFALATVAGDLVMLAADRAAGRGWLRRCGPRTLAGLLAQARLAPLTLALAAAPLVVLAFWRFEPAGAVESTGPLLPVLAAAGAVLLAHVAWRAVRTLRTTRALGRTWRTTGTPARIAGWPAEARVVAAPFPVVAVVGVWRPMLVMARQVVQGCTPAELAVIAAHERAHVQGRDNLARLVFAVAPDLSGAGARLERRWSEATEALADLRARAAGDGITLARALTRVARMATGPAPQWPVSALIDAGVIETRVRRLLAPAEAPGRAAAGVPSLAILPLAAATALLGLRAVYEAAEWLVAFGR